MFQAEDDQVNETVSALLKQHLEVLTSNKSTEDSESISAAITYITYIMHILRVSCTTKFQVIDLHTASIIIIIVHTLECFHLFARTVQREHDVKESILFMAKQCGTIDPEVS